MASGKKLAVAAAAMLAVLALLARPGDGQEQALVVGAAGPSSSSARAASADPLRVVGEFSLGDMFLDLPKYIRDLPKDLRAKVVECVKRMVSKCVVLPTRSCLKDALAECVIKA